MPRDASAGPVDQVRVRIGMQAAHLDGSHPDTVPVANEHIVGLNWVRVVADVSIAVAPGWDMETEIPYDVKQVTAKYELPDGRPFNNPQGDLHHRDETLEGVSDLSLVCNRRLASLVLEGDFLRIGVGFTIPTGRVEDDPYRLGAMGLKHEHIQFGSGTVDPLARLDYALQFGSVGLDLSLSVRQPLYESSKGYHASGLFDLAIGPRLRAAEWISVSVHYVVSYQERAFWHDVPDSNSGYVQQGIAVAAPVAIGHGVTVVPMVMRTLSIRTRDKGDTYEMDWTGGIAIDVAVGVRKE